MTRPPFADPPRSYFFPPRLPSISCVRTSFSTSIGSKTSRLRIRASIGRPPRSQLPPPWPHNDLNALNVAIHPSRIHGAVIARTQALGGYKEQFATEQAS